jgi:hypothetical protein
MLHIECNLYEKVNRELNREKKIKKSLGDALSSSAFKHPLSDITCQICGLRSKGGNEPSQEQGSSLLWRA